MGAILTGGTTVTGRLTPEQMQQEAAKRQDMANAANPPANVRKFQYFAGFEGTRNDNLWKMAA
jgi:hypothetical protein